MSSLKEKAKTGQEIYESIAEHYYHSDRERKELWVRLEDAEQEIAKLQNLLNTLQMVNDRLKEQLEEQDWLHRIEILEAKDKNAELKKKLQQLLNEFPNINDERYKFSDSRVVQDIINTNALFIKDISEWKKKFGELLRDRMTTVEERIEIAKKAIIAVRHDIARRQTESKEQVPPEYLFGCIGILEFIETGDVDKVLVPDMKRYIEKLLKEEEE